MLPIRQAEFRLVEGILAVNPAREAVADERSIHEFEEPVLLSHILRDERGDETGAVAVEPVDGIIDRGNNGERDLWALLPLPLGSQTTLFNRFRLAFLVFSIGPCNRYPAGEPGLGDRPKPRVRFRPTSSGWCMIPR